MNYCKRIDQVNSAALIILFWVFPLGLSAETKTWTGYGGDNNWSNPLNWSASTLPVPTDDVLLDNRDMPVSYQVTLPDAAIMIRSLRIQPTPGRNIELILPSSNKTNEAFSVTGPGYGIDLGAGAIFRNASGITSGESLRIADSIIIRDGGRYIHQTRGSHANNIVSVLSTAPGTQEGIFDFDVPRASYTISVSNRTYGSLELHATALGAPVNYTCTGASPLLIRGNLRIGTNASLSVDLSGSNGNIQVEGDYIQEGGQVNLASGAGDNTVLRIKGDLYQSPASVITETNTGMPWLEVNGERPQEMAMAGQIRNQVGFRMNNPHGLTLRLPLILPWKLELLQGTVFSSAALLTLDVDADILADSSNSSVSFLDGPVRKLGLNNRDHFLFPVGKNGKLRWVELKNASGNYTVEYFHQDPEGLGQALGPGLDHISKLEYWSVMADSVQDSQATIELSYSSPESGGVTDPEFLHVAWFESGQWLDGGHTEVTGNFAEGSVTSSHTDFSAKEYTLASTVNMANPLPVTDIRLEINEVLHQPVFKWTIESPEIPDHFELYEVTGGQSVLITKIKAIPNQSCYTWTCRLPMQAGEHYFRIVMKDMAGNEYKGKIVPFKKEGADIRISLVSAGNNTGNTVILISADFREEWSYEIISVNGKCIKKGSLTLQAGNLLFDTGTENLSAGVYVFRAINHSGKIYSILFTHI